MQKKKRLGLQRNQIFNQGFFFGGGEGGGSVKLFGKLCVPLKRSWLRPCRGNNILILPKPKTTSYGLKSWSYLAAKLRNAIPDSLGTNSNFKQLKRH